MLRIFFVESSVLKTKPLEDKATIFLRRSSTTLFLYTIEDHVPKPSGAPTTVHTNAFVSNDITQWLYTMGLKSFQLPMCFCSTDISIRSSDIIVRKSLNAFPSHLFDILEPAEAAAKTCEGIPIY